jgi:hypothetical protein
MFTHEGVKNTDTKKKKLPRRCGVKIRAPPSLDSSISFDVIGVVIM